MCHTRETNGAIILNMPRALQPGPQLCQSAENVVEPGTWLRRQISDSKGSHSRSSSSYCPDLRKRQINPVPHLKHPEYQKIPVDGVICEEYIESINLDPLTHVSKNATFFIFLQLNVYFDFSFCYVAH